MFSLDFKYPSRYLLILVTTYIFMYCSLKGLQVKAFVWDLLPLKLLLDTWDY